MASDTKPSGAAETNRLRDEIDRGGTGDKVAFTDPATAPLGTDDEAGGSPPARAQAAQAHDNEAARSAAAPHKRTPGELQGRHAPRHWPTIITAALAVAAVAALAIWMS